MDSVQGDSGGATGAQALYFDGLSNTRRPVTIAFSDQLDIRQDGSIVARWAYSDIRRSDSPAGILRVACLSAPPLARLEIRDATLAAKLASRSTELDAHHLGRRGVARIVGWSLAAAISIIVVVLFGVPLAADRLAPLVPKALERRIGDAAEAQIKGLFGAKVCGDREGQAAFSTLVNRLHAAAGFDGPLESAVLSTSVPNAFALPGGKVFLLKGLLEKAESPDEIAGVLAHELGHVKHHDNMRALIHNGGTSFLVGLLFGDITGSGALIFASRSLVEASYSREAEEGADTFAIEVMRALGRSPKPMAELMFRVTGKEGSGFTILSSHPLTEDRLARMGKEERPVTGAPLLTAEEWKALKAICGSAAKT
ncbi:MAG: M48 family metallopeptidase [Bradyrhizobium sp.]|uniref:M48 family metallopeptidase n=1 Tax=Bradyrhizobium sp. TaxID=376 RepID=UPI0025BBFE1F|nr:M48 family metallopeptidase [Bradyrhizobium sp.]MBI5264674.1 M48 family metallopeptidase [Bradyrhizobium sp.]